MADKMRTAVHPITHEMYEVENEEIRKIFQLNDNTYLAYSGDNEFWTDIVSEIEREVNPNDSLKKVRAKIEKIYHKYFQRYQWTKELGFIGFTDMNDYVNRAHTIWPQSRIDAVDARLRALLSPGELLMVGVEDAHYKIYALNDPGILKPANPGHTSAGSGLTYANPILDRELMSSMTKDEVEEVMVRAKKAAEAANGVGKTHDVVYLPTLD